MSRSLSTAAKLRTLIAERLPTDAEFEAFCIDHFPEVKRRFGATQDHLQKVNLLLELADQQIACKVILNHYPQPNRQLSRRLPTDFQSKPDPSHGFWHSKLIAFGAMILLVFIIALICCAYKYAMAIQDSARVSFKNEKPIFQLPPSLAKKPMEFSSTLEQIIVTQLGVENVVVWTYKEFDVHEEVWVRGIVIVDKRTNRPAIFMIIPESEVRAWVSSLPVTQPLAREIIIEAMRVSNLPNAIEIHNVEPSHLGEEKSLLQHRPSERPAQKVPAAAGKKFAPQPLPGSRPIGSTSAAPTEEPEALNVLPSVDMKPPDLLPAQLRPKIVPAIFLNDQYIYNPVPRLSDNAKLQTLCTRFSVIYKMCIGTTGSIISVDPIRSLPSIDQDIRGILLGWKFKSRDNPVCFINQIPYEIDYKAGCQIVDVELPEWSNINQRQEQKTEVSANIVKKIKISSGDDPHLPDSVKTANRNKTISGSYKVCISLGGVIYSVQPIGSINVTTGTKGGDEAVMAAVSTWKYKPVLLPTCFVQYFEFHIG